VFLPCVKCGKPALRTFQQVSTCQSCGSVNEATSDESFKWAEMSHPTAPPRAWCGDCGYTTKKSVVELGSSSLCLACHSFDEHSAIDYCSWCDEPVTGSVGDRVSPGCVRCAHFIAYEEQNEPAPEYMYDLDRRRANRNRR